MNEEEIERYYDLATIGSTCVNEIQRWIYELTLRKERFDPSKFIIEDFDLKMEFEALIKDLVGECFTDKNEIKSFAQVLRKSGNVGRILGPESKSEDVRNYYYII